METQTQRASLTVAAQKNLRYVQPPFPIDTGHLIGVPVTAPGRIVDVRKTGCAGEGCGWVYECPDGGKCGRDRFTAADGSAT